MELNSMKKVNYSIIKDIEEIDILKNREVFNYNYDQEEINSLKKHFIMKDSLYILARYKNEFAGFCSIDRNWWEDDYFFLRQILVNSNFRKMNIGSEVMSRCIKHAKDKKAIGVVTETAFDNLPMQRLCEKIGFKKWDNKEWKEGITYKLVF